MLCIVAIVDYVSYSVLQALGDIAQENILVADQLWPHLDMVTVD